ncbi:MAG TPA: 8-oxo-dGTP diphosphatase MutT [Parvularcula sp.]|nr:8-oxo-dGTP diphosphatase MutT [Parvularcula sp.]
MATLLIVAAAALIDADGRVLLARRPQGKAMAGLWEFPGGKLDEGETPEEALVRELREELGIEAEAQCMAPVAFASCPAAGQHLLMPLFALRKWKGLARPLEHEALAWATPSALSDYDLAPADKPLAAQLRDLL